MSYECPKCYGSGSNKSLPKMTRGMWHACERCRGSGWDIKRIGVGPHETVKLMPPCKCKENRR